MSFLRISKKKWIALIILAWGIVATTFYFVLHKPLNLDQAFVMTAVMVDLLVALILTCLAGSLGRLLLGEMCALNSLERVSIQFAFGLGFFSLVVLGLGLSGLFNPAIAWGVVLIYVIICRRAILGWLKDLWKGFFVAAPKTSMDRISLLFVGFIFLINLSMALAPPMRWDSLVYHLEIPRRYVAASGISFLFDNLYAGFPGVSTMWYSWAILMATPTSAAAFGWAVGLMAIAGLLGLSYRVLNGVQHWLPAAILLSGSSISQALHWAYVDWWIIFFGVCLWILLLQTLERHARIWLVLSGALLGFAIGVKYTAGILLILFTGALILARMGRPIDFESPKDKSEPSQKLVGSQSIQGWRLLVVEWLILALIVFITVSPWLIKNYLYTGQALYPMALGQQMPDPWQQTFGRDPSPKRTWLEDVLLPIDSTIYGIEGAQIAGKPEYSASLGPLFLALIPALCLGWKKRTPKQRNRLKLLIILTLGTWLIWAGLSHIANELLWPRHYFGVFPVLAILAAAGYQGWDGLKIGQVRLQRMLAALILIVFFLSALHEYRTWVQRNPLAVLSGVESRDAYLSRQLGFYYTAMLGIQQLPEQARVLFLWEPRVFYCQNQACLTDATLDNWWFLRRAYSDSETIASRLCQHGITNILLYHSGADWMEKQVSVYSDQDWEALQAFLSTEVSELESFGGEYTLYQLISCSQSIARYP